jgi:Pentatricopeptide repeat domain
MRGKQNLLRSSRNIAGVGSKDSVLSFFKLFPLVINMGGQEKVCLDALNRMLTNWLLIPHRRGISELEIAKALGMVSNHVPLDCTIFSLILNARATPAREQIYQYHSPLKGEQRDAKLHKLIDECKENAIVQQQVRLGDVYQAIVEARLLVDRGFKMHEETFMSVLIGSLASETVDQDEVTNFLTWAGDQYERGMIEVNVQSIRLFATVVTDMGGLWSGEPLVTILNNLVWIGDQVKLTEEPTVDDYASAIKFWVSAGETKTAMALLNHVEKNTDVSPNLDCFNIVLSALASAKECDVDISDLMTRVAESIGTPPNYGTYRLAIQCLKCCQHDAGNKAMAIAREMAEVAREEKLSQRLPDELIYRDAALIATNNKQLSLSDKCFDWLENEARSGNTEALRSFYQFRVWIFAWRHSGMSISLKEALSILWRMHGLVREGLMSPPPNAVIFHSAMKCLELSDDPNKGSWVEKVLSDFDQCGYSLKSRSDMYHAVISFFSNLDDARKAEETLSRYNEHLQESSPGTRKRPNVKDFNYILRAWSDSDAPRAAERASAIVDHMKKLQGVHLDVSIPNKASYEILLQCWEKSQLPTAKVRSDEIRNDLRRWKSEQTTLDTANPLG